MKPGANVESIQIPRLGNIDKWNVRFGCDENFDH